MKKSVKQTYTGYRTLVPTLIRAALLKKKLPRSVPEDRKEAAIRMLRAIYSRF